MSASSPGDGGVTLPSYDPWAGDPAEFDVMVPKLVRREERTTEIRIGITSLLNDPSLATWLGKSADAFRHTVDPLPNLLNEMADAYNQAATALRTYTQALRDGQASFAKVQSSLQAQVATNPANAGGRGGAAEMLMSQAQQASSEHDRAKQTCAKEVASADIRLRVVKSSLADPRFADFTATFTGLHGDLGDLAGLQHMGMDLSMGQLDAVRAALDGADGALTPDQLRAEIQDMIDEYGDNPDFWLRFGPLLERIPGYFNQHDKRSDGGLSPEDQVLLAQLGQATAKAAAAGSLNFLIADTNSTDLMGLSAIVAAAGGGQAFGNGPGAQFLADLVTKLTLIPPATQDGSNPTAYGNALLQALQAAAQNGDAARIALSGDNGRQLALQILKDSTTLTSTTYVGGQESSWTPPPLLGGDGSIVHSFLDAALLHGDARTNSLADQQSVAAAFNVIHAAVDYKAWDPTNYKSSVVVEKHGLPVNVNNGLIDYANTYMFDLGRSLGGNSTDGIFPIGGEVGRPTAFYIPFPVAQDFLKFALADPKAAGRYLGNAQVQLTHAMSLAMKSDPKINYTPDYSNLAAQIQKILDAKNFSDEQRADARAAGRLTVLNALAGGFGNAPGGNLLGVAQMVDGLLQPTVTGGIFDTGHAESALHANSLNDLYLNHMGRALATQAAVDAGILKPSDFPPGVLASNKTIIPGGFFESWYEDHWEMSIGGDSLDTYANELSKAIGEQVGP